MISNDVQLLMKQIENIILNKSIDKLEKCNSKELADIQEAIFYLYDCILEVNEFSKNLSKGILDVTPPSRENFLAGNLKELQAGLRHLTWQATQVAKGDYHQRVEFLGEFSKSFNTMITQLEEREKKLKEKAEILEQSRHLMVSVMNGVGDWIIVVENENKKVIFENKAAKKGFYNLKCEESRNNNKCMFLNSLLNYNEEEMGRVWEHPCCSVKKVYKITSFPVEWNGKHAFAHLICDITHNKKEEEKLKSMVYKDTLTEVYNRRYCIESIQDFLNQDIKFTICFIDIDGLKYVNDNFGHNIGDEYIKHVCKVLISHTRHEDIICRIGGDEFIVLMKDCEKNDSERRMASIRERIIKSKREFPMSISYGLVEVTSSKGQSPEKLLGEADSVMYKFKKQYKPKELS